MKSPNCQETIASHFTQRVPPPSLLTCMQPKRLVNTLKPENSRYQNYCWPCVSTFLVLCGSVHLRVCVRNPTPVIIFCIESTWQRAAHDIKLCFLWDKSFEILWVASFIPQNMCISTSRIGFVSGCFRGNTKSLKKKWIRHFLRTENQNFSCNLRSSFHCAIPFNVDS